jgi:hypothetical protein
MLDICDVSLVGSRHGNPTICSGWTWSNPHGTQHATTQLMPEFTTSREVDNSGDEGLEGGMDRAEGCGSGGNRLRSNLAQYLQSCSLRLRAILMYAAGSVNGNGCGWGSGMGVCMGAGGNSQQKTNDLSTI